MMNEHFRKDIFIVYSSEHNKITVFLSQTVSMAKNNKLSGLHELQSQTSGLGEHNIGFQDFQPYKKIAALRFSTFRSEKS